MMFRTTQIGHVLRISNGFRFVQIKRVGREWHAELRNSDDGRLVRYAGIWNRKRDAIEEAEFLLSKVEHKE